MKKNVSKVIDIIIYSIFTISVFIEGYYFNLSSTKAGLIGFNYMAKSIFWFIISVLFLIIYWLVRYNIKKSKK